MNHNSDNIDNEIRQAMQKGTDRAAAAAPRLWHRLHAARARTAARSRWKLPVSLVAASATVVAAVFLITPTLAPSDDLISPPAAAQNTRQIATGKDLVKQFEQLQASNATTGELLNFLRAELPGAQSEESVELASRYIDLVESKITIHMNYEDGQSSRLAEIALSGDEAMNALIDLRGKTELGNLADKLPAEDKAFLQELLDAGYIVEFADGMPYAEVRYRDLADIFGENISDELKEYIAFSAKEAEEPYALEGMFEVELVEVARRWQQTIDYLETYKETTAVRRAKMETYRELYPAAYLTNFGQLFRVEDWRVTKEQQAWLSEQITAIEGQVPMVAALLKEYKALLEQEDWKLTAPVREFISAQGVTLYEWPVEKLTWDNLKIWGVKLDIDGDDAIAALSAAIADANFDGTPVEDDTTEDAGGKTRTVRWSEGTTAVIRNTVLYSITTTNPVAPLPVGIEYGNSPGNIEFLLGDSVERPEGSTRLAWGVGSNDNLFVEFENNQAASVTISLTE